MKKKTLPASEARKLAESILKKGSRLKSLFRLYDMTIDAWSPETDFKSSKSVKFEERDEPTKLTREVRGETVKFDTYEFMLNDLHVQFGKHYGQNDLCDLDISLAIDKALVFIVNFEPLPSHYNRNTWIYPISRTNSASKVIDFHCARIF